MTCEDCLHIEVCAYIKPDLPICCGFAHQYDAWFNRCPNCGAKMDGGADNGC